jgi:hypothetical protein
MEQKPAISYFYYVFVAAILGSVAIYFYAGWMGVYQTNILSVLELSLSFDNAIINALILANITLFWRKMFITWGMIIAIFGMRLLFPILIVYTTTDLDFIEAFTLSVNNPAKYEEIIQNSHHILMSFGGTFLLMVFLTFLFDKERKVHWIAFIEERAAKWASLGEIKIATVMITMSIIGYFAPNKVLAGDRVLTIDKSEIVLGMVYGVTLYVIIELIRGMLEGKDESKSELECVSKQVQANALKGGFASFMYLELIDTSFSFDGVLGAFAITQNIIIMMIGLGIGAFAVRSLTLLLVDRKTVQEYRYLEHGAMWSIGMLAASMIVQIFVHLPSFIVTTIAIVPITVAFINSIYVNRRLIETKG